MTRHKVLLPLDGSAFSQQIITTVREYLKPAENELVLLRVTLPVILPSDLSPALSGMSMAGATRGALYTAAAGEIEPQYVWTAQEKAAHFAQVKAELEAQANQLRQAGYQVTTEVLFGEPAQAITEYVNQAKIDLVAMTTHGRTGLGRLLLGSVAENVLRHVTIPVLLLRTAALH